MTIDLNIDLPGPNLNVRFYGTRGSIPVPHPDFLEFGGNTTCVAIMSDDLPEVVAVFDAGTGIRDFGIDLKSPGFDRLERITMMFSHFHWDHIQGFPFFDPAYNPAIQVNILVMGVNRKFKDIKQIFSGQMQEQYFPVKLDDMGSNMAFIYPDSDIRFDRGATLTAIAQNHPGGSWGYRLELAGRSVVFCTDIEHGEEVNQDIVEFAKGADLLIHEAQYTSEELLSHKGWGHSSYEQAMEVARAAGVGYLAMTHHDPAHDDAFLKDQEAKCRAVMPNCVLAREGMEFKL